MLTSSAIQKTSAYAIQLEFCCRNDNAAVHGFWRIPLRKNAANMEEERSTQQMDHYDYVKSIEAIGYE